MKIDLPSLTTLVKDALLRAGANQVTANATAKALVFAEAQGLQSHGLSRVVQYTTHLRNERANGLAQPTVVKRSASAFLIDAQEGLAFAACDLAIKEAINAANLTGIAFAGVTRSHHCGVLVDHLRAVADAGMVGLGFANSPAAMPAVGGRHPIFGTNPIAAIFPRRNESPLAIDLSLSQVARGKLMVAANAGQAIPEGWALDIHGQPTTDPRAGMAGSMLPIGSGSAASHKGGMLALVVELLVTALIGANFGYEASSFFVDEGNSPRLGQSFIVINPALLAGQNHFFERIEILISEMLKDDGVRLPGERRIAIYNNASVDGIEVSEALLASWI